MRNTMCAVAAIALLACGAAVAADRVDTYAGGGTPATGNGDGGQATQARITDVVDLAFDSAGNLYFAEQCRIRKVTPAGIITTIGGNGLNTAAPANGASATSGSICSKTVAVDRFGSVYYGAPGRINKIDAAGTVRYVAGTGTVGFSGDGGQALSAKLALTEDIVFDGAGNLYFADDARIRKIATNGVITTIAGNGITNDRGDNGPATLATVTPSDLAVDDAGNLYFVDAYILAVRKIDATGYLTRIWGGFPAYRGDPMAAVMAARYPSGVVVDASGRLIVSNQYDFASIIGKDNAIWHFTGVLNPSTWDVEGPRVVTGSEGDGGPAQAAKWNQPSAVALDPQGNVYIADKGNARIRKITVDGGLPGITAPPGAGALLPALTQRQESTSQRSIGVVKGHANADALLDLFVLTSTFSPSAPIAGDWMLYTYRQNADGTFAAPTSVPVPHVTLTDVMAIELNHDRYTDIVISATDYYANAGGLWVMMGGPNGFSAPVAYTGVDGRNRVAALQQADMDHDGNMDVLAYLTDLSSLIVGNWTVYYGNGNGQLVRKKRIAMTAGSDALFHDFNDDGRTDMLFGWSDAASSGVAVAYHDGVDSLLPPLFYSTEGMNRAPGTPVIGDFNRDEIEDIIGGVGGNAPNSKLVQWAHTAGGFVFVRELPEFDSPDALIAADMNFDGRDDLLVRHWGAYAIGYRQQDIVSGTDSDLSREVKFYAKTDNQAQPHGMTVGDFNNDQCLDVAVTASNSGLQLLYGTRCNKVKPVSNPPLYPHGGATATGTTTAAPASVATTVVTNEGLWAASQKFARTTWRATAGAWNTATRWTAGALGAGMFVWVLIAGWPGLRRRML